MTIPVYRFDVQEGGLPPMSLRERLAAASVLGQGLPCPVAVILRTLDPDDAQALDEVLRTQMGQVGWLSANIISDTLRAEGINIHPSSVQKHRRGSCRCVKGTPK